MAKLEEQISLKRETLDSQEPRPGHEDRFLAKLRKEGPYGKLKPEAGGSRVRFLLGPLAQAAATAVLLILVVFAGTRYFREDSGPALSEEVLAAEAYYSGKTLEKYEEIRACNFGNTEDKVQLLQELDEMERGQEQLLEELRENPGDERAKAALIQHYQLKMDVLNRVIMQLKQVESVINQDDENTHI